MVNKDEYNKHPSNDKVCDNGNAMKQCNFQNNFMVSLHTGRFVFAHLYSTFLWLQKFSLRGKFISKITIFAIFGAIDLHF